MGKLGKSFVCLLRICCAVIFRIESYRFITSESNIKYDDTSRKHIYRSINLYFVASKIIKCKTKREFKLFDLISKQNKAHVFLVLHFIKR